MKLLLRYYLLLLPGMLMASCGKFLDVKPKDFVSDDQTITDKTSAQTALRGTYRKLSADSYYGSLFQTFGYLPGDNVQWTGSQSVIQQFITHNIQADNGNLASVWSAIYATINSANHVIAKVPGVNDPAFSTEERNQVVGEALVIRALSYFDLARAWGNVPVTLTPTLTTAGKDNVAQSKQDDVYAQVLADLEAAEPLLKVPATPNPVRINQETVWALKARYYVYRGRWADAAAYAAKVLADQKNYQLAQPYSAFFSPASAVATRESVLELSYSATYTNNHRNSWQPPANGGTRQWAPADAFVTLVNDAAVGGNRKALIAQTSAGLWYGNLYYRSPATDPAYIIRIAELYLTYAEALAQQGKVTEALTPLNAVRNRAGLADFTSTTKADVLLAIENERRIEFAFEPHRWFDLVRTNRAAAVLGVTDTRKYLFPIPAQEILLSKGRLLQNPGY